MFVGLLAFECVLTPFFLSFFLIRHRYHSAIGKRMLLDVVGPSCVATAYATLEDTDFVRWSASLRSPLHFILCLPR